MSKRAFWGDYVAAPEEAGCCDHSLHSGVTAGSALKRQETGERFGSEVISEGRAAATGEKRP
jgi:hypothetical protein